MARTFSDPSSGGAASINPPTPMVSRQFSFNHLDLQNAASYDVGFLDYITSYSVSEVGGASSAIANSDEDGRDFGGRKRKKNLDSFQNHSNKREAKLREPQTMENSSSKEEYIHMLAKRGQATNSHSLAERMRREKISERMRFLQNLVPGCNKITGKAVMLDEIINYVQSLQSQVEFLSMKLSTVNPEPNQMLTNDIVVQTSLGSNPDHLNYGIIAQNYGSSLWDDDLQNVVFS